MMKRAAIRIVALMAVASLMATAIACGGGAPAPTATPAPKAAQPTTPAAEPTKPAAAPAPTKAAAAPASSWAPSKAVEFVVHTNPGDGIDLMLRTLQDIISKEKWVTQTINVMNKSGGSGATAMGYVATKAGDPHYLITTQPSGITTPLRNKLNVSYKDFTPVSMIMTEPVVAVVKHDSPFKTMKELIEEAKKAPKKVSMGTGVMGASDTIFAHKIEKAAGVQFNIIPSSGGGGENMVKLLGGNVDFIAVNPSEAMGQVDAKKVRLLAISSDKRSPYIPDVPTLKEQGVNATHTSFRGMLGTKDMPADAVKFWEDTFKKTVATDAWKKFLKDNVIEDYYMPGKELGAFLVEEEKIYKEILDAMGLLKN